MYKYVLTGSFLLFQITSEVAFAQSGFSSEDALIKETQDFFLSGKYSEAAPLYAQLLSTHPLNDTFHLNYGISMLSSFKNKSEAVYQIEMVAKAKKIFPETDFYLAKAYHLTYQFAKAMERLELVTKNPKENKETKQEADILFSMCRNAQSYDFNAFSEFIISKEETREDDGISLYNFENYSGKFLAKPEKFAKGKGNKENTGNYVFLSASGNFIVFSGPGKSNTTELFISRKRFGKNEWTDAQPVKFQNETPGNKITPVISSEGDTLYFSWNSSKSIGGYDVFQSVFNRTINLWSEPENLGPPINSVYDDFNFLSSAENDFAYVCSVRDCDAGKINVLKIDLKSLKTLLQNSAKK
ncbi:MAG: hypothetical protein ABI855_19060 [Bacteroidota bacterium]